MAKADGGVCEHPHARRGFCLSSCFGRNGAVEALRGIAGTTLLPTVNAARLAGVAAVKQHGWMSECQPVVPISRAFEERS